MRFYIIKENKHAGELQEGLKLETKFEPLWFDNREDFEAKCKELKIETDEPIHEDY